MRVEDPTQVVLVSDPPRRLSYTWHTVDPELAAETRSKVTFDLEGGDDGVVKLTVTYEGFDEGSAVLESNAGGWPRVLAKLKKTGSSDPWYGAPARRNCTVAIATVPRRTQMSPLPTGTRAVVRAGGARGGAPGGG